MNSETMYAQGLHGSSPDGDLELKGEMGMHLQWKIARNNVKAEMCQEN